MTGENQAQNNLAPRVFFVDVVEPIEAEDAPTAAANFAATTSEICEARAQ